MYFWRSFNTDCLSALMVEKRNLITNNANRLLRLQIAAFGVLRVQTLGTKALNKEFIRTPKLTCSRVTKTNYNLHGNQSKLSLFCVKFQFRISKHRLCSWYKKTLKSLVSAECLVYQSQKFT